MKAIWNCAQGLLSGLHATYLRNITHRDVSPRNRLKTGRWQPPPSKGGPRLTLFFPAVQRLRGPSTEIWPDVAAVEHWNAASPEFDPGAKTLTAVGAHGVSMFSTTALARCTPSRALSRSARCSLVRSSRSRALPKATRQACPALSYAHAKARCGVGRRLNS